MALPSHFEAAFLRGIYAGMSRLAEQHGVAIVGGETTTNPERLLISVCCWAMSPRTNVFCGPGPKRATRCLSRATWAVRWREDILEFEPRLAEARWLAGHFAIHAMIDLSDGLAGDLRHLLRRSNAGAEILARAIPISRAARLQARAGSSAKTPLLAALSDGEDFELLFTVAGRDAAPLLEAWKKQFPKTRLSCIGKITSAPGLKLRTKPGVHSLDAHGYVHFA